MVTIRRFIYGSITVIGIVLDVVQLAKTIGIRPALISVAGIVGLILIAIGGSLFVWDLLHGSHDRGREKETNKPDKSKPSRRQNCEKLSGLYLDYYDKFKNLLDEIAKSRLEDYKKFLKDNEMLAEYKGSSKNTLKKAIKNILIEQGLPQLKHPMLENGKTGEMKSLIAEMLKLANVIHPNLHGELSRSLLRLDMDGYFILLDKFSIKYPVNQTDSWFASLRTQDHSQTLTMAIGWLEDEPKTMLKIINSYKSWWGWVYR